MVKKIKYIFLIFFLFGAFSATLKSQDIQAIAVIVNDEVISRYDVNQRVRLILVTSGIPATEENIIKGIFLFILFIDRTCQSARLSALSRRS